MKTAIDFYAKGKQKEANANEYERRSDYAQSRFICPECGEAVFLTGSKYSNHFSHFKKMHSSSECDRRIDGVPTDSVYQRLGLPIYLRKSNKTNFELFMGFKALPNSIMNKVEREQIYVKISGENKYLINRERFSTEQTSLIPIDYVPMSDQKYHISYEPEMDLILKYWSNYADGFSFQGALFIVTEQGGKKIRHGDSISCDVEYFWVRSQPQLPCLNPGINMKKIGDMRTKSGNYFVFTGTFRSDISDDEFYSLTSYLRENLKVHLLEKQPEFIPIWPPVIRREDGYLVDSTLKNIYGYVASGNDVPKIYCYQGIKAVPTELFTDDYVAKVPILDDSVLVNIDRKYVSSGTYLTHGNIKMEGHRCDVLVITNHDSMILDETIVERTENTLLIESKQKLEFVVVRNSGQIEKAEGIGQFSFELLGKGDSIYILHNRNLLSIVTISVKASEENTESILEDKTLYLLLKKYKKSKKVQIPNRTRVRLIKVRKNAKQSYKEIETILLEDKIPVPMIKLLEELQDGRK